MFRSLRGLPISLRTRRQLTKLPPATLKLLQVQQQHHKLGLLKTFNAVQEQITSLVKVATPRQLRLLKALVIDLLSSEVIGKDSTLVASVGLKNIGSLSAHAPALSPPSPGSLSLLLTSSSDKVQALNSALQLITSTKPNQVPLLPNCQKFNHLGILPR